MNNFFNIRSRSVEADQDDMNHISKSLKSLRTAVGPEPTNQNLAAMLRKANWNVNKAARY